MKLYEPMLAQLGVKEDLTKEGFIYEPKLDGTRAVCYFNDKKIKLINRRDRDITYRYPELIFDKNLSAKSCVLDGELVVFNEKGNPDFHLLQTREQVDKKDLIESRSKTRPATYVVFDIIEKDGKLLVNLPLVERKRILNDTVKDGAYIRKIVYTKEGVKLWKEVTKRKLEGVMAKIETSKYSVGVRADTWIKIKFLKTIDAIIVGYTSEKRVISALVIAAYENDKLRYIGRVGTGFTESFLKSLRTELDKLIIKNPPVTYSGNKNIVWVKPELICEVRYLELSKDKIMRAPAFLRMRTDKKLKECTLP
ncbi:DNA ligase [Candidatus Tiddalikarchaeum anstoanum]|nr:DNA ligase [Candidatus Tiddalikarchaeum anstoanum]